ncbi:hypothetical protein Ancab_025293 [Ancistrocladus abbreviatus]
MPSPSPSITFLAFCAPIIMLAAPSLVPPTATSVPLLATLVPLLATSMLDPITMGSPILDLLIDEVELVEHIDVPAKDDDTDVERFDPYLRTPALEGPKILELMINFLGYIAHTVR